jgi:fatty acid synthase, animal type
MSDIVISGIAGRFPQSDNVEVFKENLLNKVYLVGDPENRIKFKFSGVASSHGLIKNIEKFDHEAFNVPRPLIELLDPQGKIAIELVYEAIIDAGVSPKSLVGSNTGVFVGCFNYDSLEHWLFNEDLRIGLASIGNTAYALSNRISYVFGCQGPSMAGMNNYNKLREVQFSNYYSIDKLVDTACSSSMYAVDLAYNYIKIGKIDSAIVVGSNLILNPSVTKDFSR